MKLFSNPSVYKWGSLKNTFSRIWDKKKQIDEKEPEVEERNNRYTKLREKREYTEMQERYKHMKFLWFTYKLTILNNYTNRWIIYIPIILQQN